MISFELDKSLQHFVASLPALGVPRTLSREVLALWGSGADRQSGDIRPFRIHHEALSVRESSQISNILE